MCSQILCLVAPVKKVLGFILILLQLPEGFDMETEARQSLTSVVYYFLMYLTSACGLPSFLRFSVVISTPIHFCRTHDIKSQSTQQSRARIQPHHILHALDELGFVSLTPLLRKDLEAAARLRSTAGGPK